MHGSLRVFVSLINGSLIFVCRGEKSCFIFKRVFFISNHFINIKSFDVMMSISAQDRIQFGAYLGNLKSFGHETWPTDRCNHEQYSLGNSMHDFEED